MQHMTKNHANNTKEKLRCCLVINIICSTGAATETSGAAAAAASNVPPPTTSDGSDIRRMLDHVLTVQAAHGQILVDVFDEIQGLRANLARF